MNEKVSRLKDLYERIVDGKYSLEDLEEAIELCEELMSEHREKKDVVGEIMLMIMKKSLEALYEEKKRKARSRLLKCIEKAREYIIDKRYFWGIPSILVSLDSYGEYESVDVVDICHGDIYVVEKICDEEDLYGSNVENNYEEE